MVLEVGSIPQVGVALVEPFERSLTPPSYLSLPVATARSTQTFSKYETDPGPENLNILTARLPGQPWNGEHRFHILPLGPGVAGEKAGTPVPQNVDMFLFNAFHSSQGTFPPSSAPRRQCKAPCRHMHSPWPILGQFKNTATVLTSSTMRPHYSCTQYESPQSLFWRNELLI